MHVPVAFNYGRFIDRNGHVNYAPYRIPMPAQSDFFLPLLAEAWENDIVTVVATSNAPHHTFGDRSPQRYGTVDNALITVGQILDDGLAYSEQSIPGPARTGIDPLLVGSYTIYADTENIRVAKAHDPAERYRLSGGTSYAAPQIAGLAAYLLAAPYLVQPLPGTVAMQMKNTLTLLARAPSPGGAGVAVANNGVHEIFCLQPRPSKKAPRTVDYVTSPIQGSRTFVRSLFTRSHSGLVPRQNQDPQLKMNPVFISGAYFSDDLSSRVSIFRFCHPLKLVILIADITPAVPMPRAYRAPKRLQY